MISQTYAAITKCEVAEISDNAIDISHKNIQYPPAENNVLQHISPLRNEITQDTILTVEKSINQFLKERKYQEIENIICTFMPLLAPLK